MPLSSLLALTNNALPALEPTREPTDWYAIQARCRHERSVERWLRARGYDPFVPLYKDRRKWSDRTAEIETPLFPGYVFCSFDVKARLPILSTPGVLGIVGIGKQPLSVDPRELDAIRAMLASGIDVQPCRMSPGQRVRIESGPLTGIEGVLLDVRGKNRLVVSISLLERSVSAIVDGHQATALA